MPRPAAPPDLARLAVNTIKFLTIDAVEAARSGHPGMPMGAADMAFVLWSRFLRFDPQAPDWPDRDRFVLSAGHGSMLLYSLLHLSGYGLTTEDLSRFRQWQSRTPGHPERGITPGVETTTGPLGQGFATGVGMALAARMAEARFNRPGDEIFGHRVFAIASDGDVQEGISHEAASLAGHLKLGNLVILYDDNRITIEGKTALAFSDDTARRFQAYGWHVQAVDGHDHGQVAGAIEAAIAEADRPSMIIARTHIAHGSPGKQDSEKAHGEPLGPDEVRATRAALGWPAEPRFHVPDDVRRFWSGLADTLRRERLDWEARYGAWRGRHPDLAALWDRTAARELPDDLEGRLLAAVADDGKPAATRAHSGRVIQAAAEALPFLAGGSADLDPSTKTKIASAPSVGPGAFAGRTFHFGIREHAMGAALNGLSIHGTVLPYGSTFLVFADYMRPSIRLAALMEIPAVFVFTHDSLFVGEDGPTHQPVEQVASLRLIPNLVVLRPADGPETAMAWSVALRRRHGPTALILSRQNLPPIPRTDPESVRGTVRGGYVAIPSKGKPAAVVLIGTGSELHLAAAAREALGRAGHDAAVVSMPSIELFAEQPAEYRESVIPRSARVAAIEAGRPDLWHRWIGRDGLAIGMERFGASAPAPDLAERFGFTAEAVTSRVLGWLGSGAR